MSQSPIEEAVNIKTTNKEPAENPPPEDELFKKDLTIKELNDYDGIKKPKVFIALKGVIYDVSQSPFYWVGGGYHFFAGHDASLNLAKINLDKQLLDKWEEQIDLNQEQTLILNEWVEKFSQKYHIVGHVITDPTQLCINPN